MISKSAVLHPNVKLGANVTIEDFCIIGVRAKGQPEDIETFIGDNAVIRSHSVIYAGNKIGKNFQTGNKVNIREENKIGNDVSIGTHSVIEHHVNIEDSVRIHTDVFIPEYSELKKNCWIGPKVVFTNARLPVSKNVKASLKGPSVGEFAIVGANSTLLPGIEIGSCSLIGAGSVVTKSVPPRQVVAGVPAKAIGKIDDYEEYRL